MSDWHSVDWKVYVRRKLEPLCLPADREEEIAEELALHLQQEYEKNLEAFADPQDARRATLSRFADWRLLESELAGVRRGRPEAALTPIGLGGVGLLSEIRTALRRLARQPGYSAAILLILGLGIGANATVFSTVKATLFTPLNHSQPDALMIVWATNLERGFGRFSVNPVDFVDWRAGGHSFEELALFYTDRGNLIGPERAESLRYRLVTPSFFRVFEGTPAIGRVPRDEEDEAGRGSVVVISERLWQRQFGGDADVIGRTLRLDDETLQVIGVVSPEFDLLGADDIDLWKPFGTGPTYDTTRGNFFAGVVGRLAEGATIDQAQQQLDGVCESLAAQFPDTNQGIGAFVEPLQQLYTQPIRPAMMLLWAAVLLMLVIVCVNVANLFLVQVDGRMQEVAMRTALGASRSRIVRQLLTETVMTTVAGGLLGLLLAWWGVRLLAVLASTAIPRADQNQLDWTVALYTMAVSVLIGVVAGLAPVIAALRTNLVVGLRSRHRSGGRLWHRVRSGLVVAQIALAATVLVGTGLLLRSFSRVLAQDPGFRVEKLVAFRIDPPRRVQFELDVETFLRQRAAERSQIGNRIEAFLADVAALPGVESGAAVNLMPLQGGGMRQLLDIVDRPQPERLPAIQQRVVTPGYFEVMRMPLLQGRFLDERDRDGTRRVCVISESLARSYWRDESPIGAQVTIEDREDPSRWLTVVGIVGDVRAGSLEGAVGENLYVTFDQANKGFLNSWGMDFVIRTNGDPIGQLASIRELAAESEPEWAIFNETTMEQEVGQRLGRRRFVLTLLSSFSVTVLLLAAVGLYAVLAHSVAQRRHDIGIRIAVGAARSQIVRLFLSEGLLLAVLGVGFGLVAALGLSGVVESMLFEVESQDPATLLIVALTLLGVSFVAGCLPAFRASRVDPVSCIRTQ